MLRLKAMTVHGLKGLDGTYEFGERNLILGGVGSGKSGLLDAVRFAFLGMVPRQGKTIGAAARLFSPDGGSVSVELSDGRVFGHEYTPKGKRKLGAHASWIEDVEGVKVEEITAQIRGLIGKTEAAAVEVLYGDEIVRCTPQERATRLRTVLTSQGDPEWRGHAIRAMTAQRLNGAGTELTVPIHGAQAIADSLGSKAALTPLCDGDEVLAHDVRQLLMSQSEEGQVSDLDAALKAANEEKRRWGADKRESAGAQQTAEKELAESEDPGLPVTTAKSVLEAAVGNVTRAEEALEDLGEKQDRVIAAEGVLENALGVNNTVPADPDAEVDAIRHRAKELRAKAEALEAPVAPPQPEPVTQSPEALKAQQDLRGRIPELEERLRRKRQEKPVPPGAVTDDDLGGVVERLFATWDAYGFGKEVENGLQQFRTAWRGSRRQGPEWEMHDSRVVAWEQECLALESSVSDANRQLGDAIEAERVRCERENRALQDEFAKSDAKYAVQAERVSQQRRALLEEADLLDAESDEKERAWSGAREMVSAAEAVLEAAREALPEKTLESLESDLRERRAELAKAQEQMLRCERHAGRVAALRAAERRLLAADVKERLYAAIEWSMQRVREHELMASRDQLLLPMEAFYENAIPPEEGPKLRPVFEAKKGKVEFGLLDEETGLTRSVEALSGGEFVLFTAALGASLVSMRAPEVRLLLIEAVECGLSRHGGVSVELLRGVAAVDEYVGTTLVASNLPLSEDAKVADPMGEWVEITV